MFSLNSCNHTTPSKFPVSPMLPRSMNGGAGHESQVLLTATEHTCALSICSCVLAFPRMAMEQLLSQLAEIQIFFHCLCGRVISGPVFQTWYLPCSSVQCLANIERFEAFQIYLAVTLLKQIEDIL